MTSAIPEVMNTAVGDRSATGHAPPPPWANTPAYRAYTVVAAALGVASFALTLRFPGQVLPTSTAYVAGCVIVLVVVVTLILRGVRVPGTLVGDLPEALLTTPLLVVAPHWGYVSATCAVTLWTCLRWRITALDTTFNVGIAAVSSGTATGVYHLAGGAAPFAMTWHVLLAALAGVLAQYVLSEVAVWIGCVLDGKREHAPTLTSSVTRVVPQLMAIGLASCSVALGAQGTLLGALLGHALLAIVLVHLSVQGRSANQRWIAEQLYTASERLRGQSEVDDVPQVLADELAALWQTHEWTVTEQPSRGQEAYRITGDRYIALAPGRAVLPGPTRQASAALVETAADVMRSLEFERELRRRATRDALTGLGNRHRLWDALDERLPAAGRGAPLALMSLDLDTFKAINDTYGHVVGDHLLSAVAQRLTEHCGPDDVLARMAGDEFVILCDAPEPGEAVRRAHGLQHAISEPFTLDQNVLNVTCSIGVHHVSQPTTRANALSAADAALTRAKKSGRGTVTMATQEIVLEARRLLRLDAELRAAMHHGEFTLHYQPIVEAASGETFAVEALLRWERDGVMQMSPGDFVPYAEESGLISTIGLWVMRRACLQVNAWNRANRPDRPLRVTVNISTVHIAQPTFVDDVRQILEETGFPPELLILEVTETFATLDLAASVCIGNALSEVGVSLWLDDFGTGYSSLEYLRQLPVEVVKLDRSFLTDISSDASARRFIASIVQLCRSIGREPLAEGVEQEQQRKVLLDLGCSAMQGYLFARPVPIEHLVDAVRPSGQHSRDAGGGRSA
ncbi:MULTISPECIES: putative bifunctional diguanylate cyclase/phosphodiesterase [Arsenicicoccus]|uniref:putative bifunctional diguanylate cyclase/phosphodiesterase n=1 Tax=Arsenicicoccus TaxID=267408 RepID=UPI00257CC2C8|nr:MULTISPECIES: bifunctional diguanylate cyclase/phosphodiesterase [Arsenicicoccus]